MGRASHRKPAADFQSGKNSGERPLALVPRRRIERRNSTSRGHFQLVLVVHTGSQRSQQHVQQTAGLFIGAVIARALLGKA